MSEKDKSVMDRVRLAIAETIKQIAENDKIQKEVADVVTICEWGAVAIEDKVYSCTNRKVIDSEFIVTEIMGKGEWEVKLYSKLFKKKAVSSYEWLKLK